MGSAMPTAANSMWKPSESSIWIRAAVNGDIGSSVAEGSMTSDAAANACPSSDWRALARPRRSASLNESREGGEVGC